MRLLYTANYSRYDTVPKSILACYCVYMYDATIKMLSTAITIILKSFFVLTQIKFGGFENVIILLLKLHPISTCSKDKNSPSRILA